MAGVCAGQGDLRLPLGSLCLPGGLRPSAGQPGPAPLRPLRAVGGPRPDCGLAAVLVCRAPLENDSGGSGVEDGSTNVSPESCSSTGTGRAGPGHPEGLQADTQPEGGGLLPPQLVQSIGRGAWP